jgi:hypothetical protein
VSVTSGRALTRSEAARWLALLALLAATAWDGLKPGSAPLAEHEWQVASSQLADDFSGRLYDFCALAQRDVAPWQPGWHEAHDRLVTIGRARREALAPDGWLRVDRKR